MRKFILTLLTIYIIYKVFYKTKEQFDVEDKLTSLCKNSFDFYKANEDDCKNRVGSSCNIKSYAMENPIACRELGSEPCKYFDYLVSHKEECSKYKDPNTNKPYNSCSDITYFSDNKKDCRNQGFEMCENKEYLSSNISECRINNYDICKLDINYALKNVEECRNYGVEACSIKEYRHEFVDDCLKLGFNPCNDIEFFDNPKAIICGLGRDGILNDEKSPCSHLKFLENEGNLSQCCSKGKVSISECKKASKFINPCFNEIFLNNNVDECRNTGVEPCELSKDYKIAHSIECRDKGFEPCKIKDYLVSHLEECKKLNFNPCDYPDYKENHKDECSIKPVQ